MSKDNGFKLGDKEFKMGRPSLDNQLVIAQIMSDVIAEAMPLFRKMNDEPSNKDHMYGLLDKIIKGISALPKERYLYVVHELISVVEVKQSGLGWAKIYKDGVYMFDDLNVGKILTISAKCFMFNFSDVFGDVLQLSQGQSKPSDL